jgi:hypothetical protein
MTCTVSLVQVEPDMISVLSERMNTISTLLSQWED